MVNDWLEQWFCDPLALVFKTAIVPSLAFPRSTPTSPFPVAIVCLIWPIFLLELTAIRTKKQLCKISLQTRTCCLRTLGHGFPSDVERATCERAAPFSLCVDTVCICKCTVPALLRTIREVCFYLHDQALAGCLWERKAISLASLGERDKLRWVTEGFTQGGGSWTEKDFQDSIWRLRCRLYIIARGCSAK